MQEAVKKEGEAAERRGLRLDPTINAGAILQVIVVGGSIVFFILGMRAEVSNISSDVQRLNTRLTEEVSKLSGAITRLGDALVPFARAQVEITQLERRVNAGESRNDSQEDRLNRITESVVELRTKVENVVEASRQNLPGAPGSRR